MKTNNSAQFAVKDNRPSSIAGRHSRGFTLTELLMGLMVGSIVLAAAATMAGAMSSGKRQTENMTRTATYLAQLHTRISDLVMRAEQITEIADGIELLYANGHAAAITTDDAKRIVIEQSDRPDAQYVYLYRLPNEMTGQLEPVQTAAAIEVDADRRRVTVTLIIQNDVYTLTATRRGGR